MPAENLPICQADFLKVSSKLNEEQKSTILQFFATFAPSDSSDVIPQNERL